MELKAWWNYKSGARVLVATIVLLLSSSSFSAQTVNVRLDTDLGAILLELYADRAPVTVRNFLRYVDEGRYKEAAFYRTVHMGNQSHNRIKIEVIQGGLGYRDHPQRLPSIPLETTRQTGIHHRDGVISMARTAAPDSANSEIFICIGDQPELDYGGMRYMDGKGFAAFGRVLQGMEIVKAIQSRPANGQILNKPVRILAAKRIRGSDMEAKQ